MTKLIPLEDRIIVKPVKTEEKTAGGLHIPDSAREKPMKGEILAVGEGNKEIKMYLEVGQKVLYGKLAGTEIIEDENPVLIMRQSDVLAAYK